MLKLGVHVSIAGSISKSAERAAELNCNTMQIFSRNPRQWRKGSLSEEDIEAFRKEVRARKIKPVIIHIPYTLNLASTKRTFYKITIRDFITDLIEANKLGAQYLVTHMGSYKGGTQRGGLLRIANALKKILKATKGIETKILLENTSGSGHWFGSDFLDQKFILETLDWPSNIGLCLDTAHAWAAGYQIDNAIGLNDLLRHIDTEIGIKRVFVVHLNDTNEELGSLRDRHFAIGKGKIGEKGFSLILNHPKLRNLPFILETPKVKIEDDIENLNTVRRLYKDNK